MDESAQTVSRETQKAADKNDEDRKERMDTSTQVSKNTSSSSAAVPDSPILSSQVRAVFRNAMTRFQNRKRNRSHSPSDKKSEDSTPTDSHANSNSGNTGRVGPDIAKRFSAATGKLEDLHANGNPHQIPSPTFIPLDHLHNSSTTHSSVREENMGSRSQTPHSTVEGEKMEEPKTPPPSPPMSDQLTPGDEVESRTPPTDNSRSPSGKHHKPSGPRHHSSSE